MAFVLALCIRCRPAPAENDLLNNGDVDMGRRWDRPRNAEDRFCPFFP